VVAGGCDLAFEIAVIARCARTLLPASSSGGDT
jgi:hypothetical protein